MDDTLSSDSLIYIQIAKMLEDDIVKGELREDQQAPSTNELAQRYRINPATAAKGLSLLAAEGLLYKRRGVGMFVAPGAAEKVREKRRAAFYRDYVKPLVWEGMALSLMGRDLLSMLRQAIEEEQNKQEET